MGLFEYSQHCQYEVFCCSVCPWCLWTWSPWTWSSWTWFDWRCLCFRTCSCSCCSSCCRSCCTPCCCSCCPNCYCSCCPCCYCHCPCCPSSWISGSPPGPPCSPGLCPEACLHPQHLPCDQPFPS